MNHSKISSRYAKALLISAKEKNILDEIEKDFLYIENLLKEVKEFSFIIEDPFIKNDKKISLVNSIIKNNINKLSSDFIKLIFKNKRDEFFTDIVRVFLDKYRKEKGVKKVILTLTREISSKTKENIINTVKNIYKAEVEVSEKINPDLIGGFILRVEDLQLDSSVANKLQYIKKQLTSTI